MADQKAAASEAGADGFSFDDVENGGAGASGPGGSGGTGSTNSTGTSKAESPVVDEKDLYE